MWGWDIIVRDNMTIRFGVSWFDAGFFKERKNAYQNTKHLAHYKKFNAGMGDFKVQHFISEDEPTLRNTR